MSASAIDKNKKSQTSTENALNLLPRTFANRLTDTDWYHVHSFWSSSLFSETYLRDDFRSLRATQLNKYESDFQTFLNRFIELCDSKRHEKFHTWNEDQTVRSWIMPVMEALGWWDSATDPVIPELTFTVSDGTKKRTYRPDCVFVPSQKVKGIIQEKDPSERLDYARRYLILTLEAKYWDRIRKLEKTADGNSFKKASTFERGIPNASASVI